jgi:hypothetical protein
VASIEIVPAKVALHNNFCLSMELIPAVRIRPAPQAGAMVCREALRQQRRPWTVGSRSNSREAGRRLCWRGDLEAWPARQRARLADRRRSFWRFRSSTPLRTAVAMADDLCDIWRPSAWAHSTCNFWGGYPASFRRADRKIGRDQDCGANRWIASRSAKMRIVIAHIGRKHYRLPPYRLIDFLLINGAYLIVFNWGFNPCAALRIPVS